MIQPNNQISAKEALRLLNYWQNTKWEIDKQERDLDKLKSEYLIDSDLYDLIYSHVVWGNKDELTCLDLCEAMDGAQEHLNMFYKPKGIPCEELARWLNYARFVIREEEEYDHILARKSCTATIDIFIKRTKDENIRAKEIKDLENHIDNLKEKYENIKEELKQMNVIVT